MPIFVSEFTSMAPAGQYSAIPLEPAVVVTQVSSGATASLSTLTLSSVTNVARITTYTGVAGYFVTGSSAITAGSFGSSVYQRIPPDSYQDRGVTPFGKLFMFST